MIFFLQPAAGEAHHITVTSHLFIYQTDLFSPCSGTRSRLSLGAFIKHSYNRMSSQIQQICSFKVISSVDTLVYTLVFPDEGLLISAERHVKS